MSEHCTQGERIATVEQRLKSGDTILETLCKEIKELSSKIQEALVSVYSLSISITGKDGVVDKQKEHCEVINQIVNGKIMEKVDKHHEVFIGVRFILIFFGITSVASILAMIYLVYNLVNIIR